MWVHYVYLLLLPTLAVVSAEMMFPHSELWKVMLLAGFAPALMYSLYLANGYALPDSLPIALIVTLAVPLQIAIGVLLSGRESVWLFFAESAAVEIGSFVFGTIATALLNKRGEYSVLGFVCLAGFALLLFFGGMIPHFISLYLGYGGLSFWMILIVTSFATAGWRYVRVYERVIARYRKKQAPQNLVMKFDGGWIANLLQIDEDMPLLSPLQRKSANDQINVPILICGFVAAFLPVIVGVTVSIVYRLK